MKEFGQLEFSITILYDIKHITINEYFGSKFVLGRDGILIKKKYKQGYFLPSVAKQFKYNKQQLLEELCTNKMGNTSKECFRTDAQLFYNEGIEFTI
jgi:AMMECR1 domain-containing protein